MTIELIINLHTQVLIKWVKEVQLIAFIININYNTFPFNCKQHAIECPKTWYSVCN